MNPILLIVQANVTRFCPPEVIARRAIISGAQLPSVFDVMLVQALDPFLVN